MESDHRRPTRGFISLFVIVVAAIAVVALSISPVAHAQSYARAQRHLLGHQQFQQCDYHLRGRGQRLFIARRGAVGQRFRDGGYHLH
jgi:hypothetical protein